jgi:hypothetical protein
VAEDLTPLLPPGSLGLRNQLFKVGARLVSSLREDWPFLSRLEIQGRTSGSLVFRPSVLFLASATLGSAQEETLINASTALDLSYLAIFAQSGVEEEVTTPGGVNWGNKFSVLLSDFLLARAFEFCSGLGKAASSQITQSFESAHVGHLEQMSSAWDIELRGKELLTQLQRKYAPLFILPCTLAAALVQANGAVPALVRYGRALSLSYALAEDVILLTDPHGVTNSAFGTDYASGLVSLPIIEALKAKGAAAARIRDMYRSRAIDVGELRKAVLSSGVLEKVQRTADHHANVAEREIEKLKSTIGTRFLGRLARFSAERSLRQRY